jgi:hypothetical protein
VSKFIKIIGYTVATLGFAYVVKNIMHGKKGTCGWHKVKVEDKKPTDETESHKIKVEDEKPTGSRYGSNPIRY